MLLKVCLIDGFSRRKCPLHEYFRAIADVLAGFRHVERWQRQFVEHNVSDIADRGDAIDERAVEIEDDCVHAAGCMLALAA